MLLNGPTIRAQVESAARTAVGTFKINNQQVRRLWLALPGTGEQQKILESLAQSTRPIDLAEARVVREVELLNEYRTRLIADVVAGKLDIRSLELPAFETEEASESPSELEGEELGDSEESAAAEEGADAV